MQLSISFDKEEYEQNDPINMNFILKNVSKDPIYVNKRFHIGSPESPKEDKEMSLAVTSPKGEELPYKPSAYKLGLPKSDYFVLLNPGEDVTSDRKKNLKGYFEMKEPGEYKVTATYQNVYGSEIGLDTFREKIESKPITTKVIGKKEEAKE